jgi:8-oxo-dGTP pyrophosphatase MutT (NUDIX family)
MEQERRKITGAAVDIGDSADTAIRMWVIAIKGSEESIQCGKRRDIVQIFWPRGCVKQCKPPVQAAIRETREELGIAPRNLKRMDGLESQPGKMRLPMQGF